MRHFIWILLLGLGCSGSETNYTPTNQKGESITSQAIDNNMRIERCTFLPWGAKGIPEKFDVQAQTSLLPIGKPSPPSSIRADIQLRQAGDHGFLVLQRSGLFLVKEDGLKVQKFIWGKETPEGKRILDFLWFKNQAVLLIKQNRAFLIQYFAPDGNLLGETKLTTDLETGGYHQLLKSTSKLYLVGRKEVSSTFLSNPSLFEVGPGGKPKLLHHWTDLSTHAFFMDSSSTVYYAKVVDQVRHWVGFNLVKKKETSGPAASTAANPYMGLPIGINQGGNCIGRSGRKVAQIDAQGAVGSDFEIESIFSKGERMYYSQKENGALAVYQGNGEDWAVPVRLPLDDQAITRYQIKNWRVIGVDDYENYLVTGFSMAGGTIGLTFGADGRFLANGPVDQAHVRANSHRLMPPAQWQVGSTGDLLVPVSGPLGLSIYRIFP